MSSGLSRARGGGRAAECVNNIDETVWLEGRQLVGLLVFAGCSRGVDVSSTCAEYLDHVLPALIARGRGAPLDRRVELQVIVPDRDDCDRCLRIEGAEVVVSKELSDAPTLTLGILSEDLEALTRNALDVGAALRRRRLHVLGDPGLLLWLSQRLAVPVAPAGPGLGPVEPEGAP